MRKSLLLFLLLILTLIVAVTFENSNKIVAQDTPANEVELVNLTTQE